MAFHGGSRGNSRGRGSSQFRGRGGNMRGRGAGRGTGRGGRGGRGGRKPVFDSARVAEKESREAGDDSEDSGSSEEDDDSEEEEAVSSDEEVEEEQPAARSYATLMQTLSAEGGPRAKRRKLNTSETPRYEEPKVESPPEAQTDIDLVEEVEEGPDTAVDGQLEDEDEKEDLTDPFEAHFANPDENSFAVKLQALNPKNPKESLRWSTQNAIIPQVGKITIQHPGEQVSTPATSKPKILGPKDLKLKQKLATVFLKDKVSFNPLEKTVADTMFNYQDLLFCGRTPGNAQELRRLTCLHAVNHVFKTRDRVLKNTARLAQSDSDLEFRDQGFTRPKVLMILPTRESCVKMVNMITSICEPEQQENRKRFDDAYVDKEEKFADQKPEDFLDLFSGNDDDMFRLGLKFTRKTIKYFSQFYNSDIIFASPLGLRMAIGTEDTKKVDYDFLSSIELVIVDQADALLMQNWEHVKFIFEHLNLQPKEAHDCDFSRVRQWYLNGNAENFRQTIALASFNTPELNSLFLKQFKNWSGKTKINGMYPGAIQELGMKVKQTFSRLESPSPESDPDARFAYFTSAIIPTLTRHSRDSAGTLIFIPSYHEFVQIRNYFSSSATTSNLSFGSICEYTEVPDVARARSHFLTGRHKVLLYTERAHHFRRYILRGVKRVIMYGLPDNPIFYKEIVGGFLGKSVVEGKLEAENGSVKVMFSKFDILKLERVVGSERVGKMLRDKGDTFNFL